MKEVLAVICCVEDILDVLPLNPALLCSHVLQKGIALNGVASNKLGMQCFSSFEPVHSKHDPNVFLSQTTW